MEQRFHEPEPPKATGEGVGVPRLEEAAPPPDAEKTTFILKSLVVEGATALPPDDLLPLWSGQLNTRISVKTLYDIAAAITARYTAAGYVLSQAVVPSQKIGSDGIARIQVIEGFVDQVVILGEADGVRDRLEEYADKIRASRPLRLAVLERYLLLASDLPGVSASGILKPSATTSGAADLVFQVARRPVEGFASLDNRGSRYIGPWQASSAVTLNSLLGRYDSTGIQVATSPFQPEELKYGYVAHEETIDSEGTKILADASYTVSHPGYTLADLALRSHAVTLGLGVSHPLIRTRAANLSVRCRVDGRDSRTDQDVSQPVSKDSIRAVRAGASLDWVDTVLVSPGVSLMAVEVSQGLDVLGARPTGSPDLSQANGHSDFVKATLDGSRTQALAPHTNLLVAFSGQLAGTSLLSSEQFAFGGSQFGHGYDPAEITGDHGLAGRVELQYNGQEPTVVKDWQVYGSWDGGKTWLANAAGGAPPTRDDVSVGIGLRTHVRDRMAVNVELDRPLTHGVAAEDDGGKDVRGFMRFVARF